MANLHVQPKKKNFLWIWVLIIILVIAAGVYYYVNYYSKGIKPGSGNAFRSTPSLRLHFAQDILVKSIPATIQLQ